jgi:hypothetical protein
LLNIPSLESYWTQQFLSSISLRFPRQLADFFFARVDIAAQTENFAFHPANYGPYVQVPPRIHESDAAYRDVIALVMVRLARAVADSLTPILEMDICKNNNQQKLWSRTTMRRRGLIKKMMATVLVGPVAACYTVRNEDMFPIQRPSLSESQLAALSIGGVRVERFVLQQDSSVDAYAARVSDARGTVVFLGGNGNEVTGVFPILLPHLQQLHLDLIVMNYWAAGQRQPNADSIRIAVNRLIGKAIEISPGPLCVMGHSVGAWFALDAASRKDVSGVVLAAVGTTPNDLTIAQSGILRPFLWLSAQYESLGLLDGIQLAGKAVTPVLVVTSTEDKDIPARLSNEVYNALPPTLGKRLLTLRGVSYGGYFRSAELWDAASQVPCRSVP